MNSCRMCLSCLTLFILISILLLCWSSPLTSVKIHRKLWPQWDFSHIFRSLGIWMFTGSVPLRGTDCILPHINKYFSKSSSRHALRSARLAVMGPRQTMSLWNSYTEGLPSWFWWMDGHQSIGFLSGSDAWSAWEWEADKRQQSCFAFTSWGLSIAEVWGRFLEIWGIRVTGLSLQLSSSLNSVL